MVKFCLFLGNGTRYFWLYISGIFGYILVAIDRVDTRSILGEMGV